MTTVTADRPTSKPRAFLREARPLQWVKNGLVLSAPAAAGVLDNGTYLAKTLLAFLVFCMISSGTYYLNDARDVEGDRAHPKKRFRPIARGDISVRTGVITGVALIVGGFAIAAAIRWQFLLVAVLYIALTTCYTLWLKHVPVVELAVVAFGFVIRAVAGGIALDIEISQWFLIVTSFGSLFMVAGKRYGDFMELGEDRAGHRSSLALYTQHYLRYVWSISSGVTITAYCLWAFEQADLRDGFPFYQLSIVPFGLALLRYAYVIDTGDASAPEEVVIGDRQIQLLGVLWALTFGCGVYFT